VTIFDAHTHFFSREFYEFQTTLVPGADRAALLDRIHAGGINVPGRNAADQMARWLAELDKNGVAHAVTFASVPAEMKVVGEAAAASGGRLVPFAMVNPRAPETLTTLESLQPTLRFRGMALFPAMHDYSIESAEASQAIDMAEKHRMIVFVHCGKLRVNVRKLIGLDADFPMEKSRPAQLIPVVRARPNLTFIVPHFGAGWFEELLELGSACKNVCTDTAGSNAWILEHHPPLALSEVFGKTREVMGADRILFGSDSGVFPRGYRADVLRMQETAMRAAGFSDRERDGVLGGNLTRILAA
jgi:predicted TIM-barrel fold metal-dependent hydrolase